MMPDLFLGDAVPLNKPGEFDMGKWRSGAYHPQGKNHLPETVDPIVEVCLSEMRSKYQCKKIGAVGYCFGGKYVVRHLIPGKMDVGYTAHPSHIDESELKGIKGPLAIAAAAKDNIFPAEKRHVSEEILQEVGFPYQINLYSGVSHGFGVRGDMNAGEVRYAMRSAFVQAVEWFNEYMKEK
ncbi:dienelactone hydrolase, putative [Talaromyces stipitatus ATCC 10500]|nr:dienelactone hydrolase, putative [Talaromyces stipitatus ATCC 10500]EED18003.1 dienelactone hydrolase, putative [Talaromyces stipitatus ATCC 10500]